jgi:glyoxylase-like metal-dependent hydrolase (beta-lactamase superfamily II)
VPWRLHRGEPADERHGDFRQFTPARRCGKLAQTTSGRAMKGIVFAALLAACAANAHDATTLAPGVDLIRGAYVPGAQPDGNSVIFRGPDGLVVMDTGRHAAHTQRIIDYAHAAGLPIKAVVNSHWHLDHVGGNPRIRMAFPGVRVYASAAIDGAMHGFLADYHRQLEAAIAQGKDPAQQQAWRDELAIIDSGKGLYPDVTIDTSQTLRLAGRDFRVHLESHAVTAGDVWLFEPKTRVLAAGDLVTLPVPFLDTACPAHWRDALHALAGQDFALLVPGHGAPMTRSQFETYRRAYANLLACASSDKGKAACIDGWLQDAKPLLTAEDGKTARPMLDYYMDSSLRADAAKTKKLCGGQ